MSRALALRMPALTLEARPNGLPMATTQSPTRTASESPSLTNGQVVRRRLELDERDVGQRVGAEHLGLERAPVVEADADVERALDHVVVGEDVAAGIDDEPAARALANLGPVPAAATEELLERIVAAASSALHREVTSTLTTAAFTLSTSGASDGNAAAWGVACPGAVA